MGIYSQTVINSAEPGIAAKNAVHTALTSAGWEFVESLDTVISETGTITGCATSSATSSRITRSGGVNWSSNGLYDRFVRIDSGTGAGQIKSIASNTTTYLDISGTFDPIPDNTSVFSIISPAYVYKSPAASNSIGHDFYISMALSGNSSGDYITFRLFEEWDAVNKKSKYYSPGSSTNAPDASHRVNDTTGLAITCTNSPCNEYLGFFAYSTAFTFYINASIDRLILGNSLASIYNPAYIGIYDSVLGSTLDPVPLVIADFSVSVSTATITGSGATTREPAQTAGNVMNFLIQIGTTTSGTNGGNAWATYPHAMYPSMYTGSVTTVKGAVGATDVYRGANLATKICFFSRRDVANNPSLRGTFKDIVVALPGNASGDILQTPDGDYVLPSVNANYFKYFIPKF